MSGQSSESSSDQVQARYEAGKQKRSRVNSIGLAVVGVILVIGGATVLVICALEQVFSGITGFASLAMILGCTFLRRGIMGLMNPDRNGPSVNRTVGDTIRRR
ncbi:MAG: hypothetical protein ACI9G1_002259 [Pirellulaceae bacterium]|jgi:hypothetical protein